MKLTDDKCDQDGSWTRRSDTLGFGPSSKVIFFTCVGGSVTERIAQAIMGENWEGKLRALWSPTEWRDRMGGGRLARSRTRLETLALFPLEAIQGVVRELPEIAVATTNPFLLPMILVGTRRFHRRPVVVLAYDLYPDALEAVGVMANASLSSRVMAATTSYWMTRADAVVFIGRRMAAHAARRYGNPRRERVIAVGANPEEFTLGDIAPETELERWCASRTCISYVGNLGEMHDWRTLAAAGARILAQSDAGTPVGIVIAATGPGVEKLRRAWSHLSEERVRFVPSLDDREWARLLVLTDIAVVTLRDSAKNTSVPSKTFSAMAAGCALMAVAPEDSDLSEVVRATACGRVVSPGDDGALQHALEDLIANAGVRAECQRRASAAARESFSMATVAKCWSELFSEIVKEDRARTPNSTSWQRLVDLTGAGLALTLSSPLLLGGALAVRLGLGSPVLFSQPRAGKDGVPFTLWKLRTMRLPREGEEGPEHDHARLGRLGRFLRSTSIDELPALWNVLKGEMSLVGPRPLLLAYTTRYSARQRRRLDVLPGITGWAQINGRNAISWQEKLAFDAWYVDRKNILLDLRILWKTVSRVLARDGISAEGYATMPEFKGDHELDG